MNELSTPQQLISGIGRRLLIVVVLAIAAAAIAFVVRRGMSEDWESVAKVAFVEDTRFDYVEAERDRLVGFVEDRAAAFLATEEIESIEFFRPNRETFLDVEVVGSDAALVADASNELAELIVAGDQAVRREIVEIELRVQTTQLAEIDGEIVAMQNEIVDQAEREAFAEANRFLDGPEQVEELTVELREAQDQLYLATRYRNALVERQVEATGRIAELDVQLEVVQSETRVVRAALLAETPVGPTPATAALFAGVSMLALGALFLAFAATEDDT